MTFLPPDEPPREPVDNREAWRGEDRGALARSGRPYLSTTQVLIGLLLVVVALGVGAALLTDSDRPAVEAAIVSPQPGAHLPPGPVVLRIRATAGQGSPVWELSCTHPGAPEQWQKVASGDGPVVPGNVWPGGGTNILDPTEPGVYQLRLIVRNRDGVEAQDAIEFTIEQ